MGRTLLLFVFVVATAADAQYVHDPGKRQARAFLDALRQTALPADAYKLVTVAGAIKRPGREFVFTLPVRPGLTVSQAIDAAGGFGDWADSRHVGLWKDAEGAFVTVDVRAFLKKEAHARDPVVEAGDIVVVLERRM
jgi:protein involved in polysaccharide export with SLBB domain